MLRVFYTRKLITLRTCLLSESQMHVICGYVLPGLVVELNVL